VSVLSVGTRGVLRRRIDPPPAQFRSCRSCAAACQVKDYRPHRIATVFGLVMIRLPRFRCAGCGGAEAGVGWPAHCRSRPEFDQLRAHLSALMPYRITAGLLEHLLPVDAGINSETLRRRDCFLRSTVNLIDGGAGRDPLADP
jgi:hypothetical protein